MSKVTNISRLVQILFGTFLFIFPFSLRFLVYEENAYRFGHFNPWVSQFVYAPEILLVAAFGLWAYEQKGRFFALLRTTRVGGALLIIFILNAFLITCWHGNWVLGLVFVWRALEAVMLYLLIVNVILTPNNIVRILLCGALFQLGLGLAQWKLNHSIGLPWLGEQVIGTDILNVAKTNLASGLKQIRPYGTFLHPNILAAYFLLVLFIALDYIKGHRKLFCLLVLGFAVFFTKSLASGYVMAAALIICALFWFFRSSRWRRRLIGVGFLIMMVANVWFFVNSSKIFINSPSINERLVQNVISFDMWREYPLGVGAQNFTLEMENFSEFVLSPWQFQPVHNSYFLVLNETGAQGFLILLAMIASAFYFWRNGKAVPLIALLLLAPFDHFLWDSFAGLILIALAAGFFNLQNKATDIR